MPGVGCAVCVSFTLSSADSLGNIGVGKPLTVPFPWNHPILLPLLGWKFPSVILRKIDIFLLFLDLSC